jgi:hypothetical protein
LASTVTYRALCQPPLVDVVLPHEPGTGGQLILGLPMQVEYLIPGAQIALRRAVAPETPLHGERRHPGSEGHRIDLSMTSDATDALGDVDAVIEVHKIGQVMHALPVQWDLAFEGPDERRQGSLVRIQL